MAQASGGQQEVWHPPETLQWTSDLSLRTRSQYTDIRHGSGQRRSTGTFGTHQRHCSGLQTPAFAPGHSTRTSDLTPITGWKICHGQDHQRRRKQSILIQVLRLYPTITIIITCIFDYYWYLCSFCEYQSIVCTIFTIIITGIVHYCR